jgi:hypothetical protein
MSLKILPLLRILLLGTAALTQERFLQNFFHNAHLTKVLQINSLFNRMHLLHSTACLYETQNAAGQVSYSSLCTEKRCNTLLTDVSELGFPSAWNRD